MEQSTNTRRAYGDIRQVVEQPTNTRPWWDTFNMMLGTVAAQYSLTEGYSHEDCDYAYRHAHFTAHILHGYTPPEYKGPSWPEESDPEARA